MKPYVMQVTLKDILVILNDNEMSISPNVGAMNNYLANLSGKTISTIKQKVINC